ncbi:MAG: ABC transporter ATP-binding protein [Rhodospirillales bacterium]|nr:ABC transporter ATP-binding protein [Rhodospirillales bacterium]
MPATAGVSIEHVDFRYGSTPILADVSLEIRRGEFFAFLGPSGSGKTTLLRLVAGFGTPNAGRIRVGDRDITHVPPWQRNVGMVFQSYALWPHMTVAENVAFGLEQRRIARAEIGKRVQDALDLVGLGGLAQRRPAQLSGGQQQRVALARTLVIEPEVLLLDEPLSNLDANLRVEMRAELLALQRKTGLTTIYVTHDQEEANATSDRIAVLDQGRIQQIGRPVDLYDRPANRFVATFLGVANVIDGAITAEPGGAVFRAAGDVAIVLDGAPAAGPASIAFRPQSVALQRGAAAAAAAGSRLAGTVAVREFLGAIMRYTVKVGDNRVLIDEPHQRDHVPAEIGAVVAVHLDVGQITLLRG